MTANLNMLLGCWPAEERSDDRSHGEGAASSFREFTWKQIGPPAGGPLGFKLKADS
jgi:hypothetical protein